MNEQIGKLLKLIAITFLFISSLHADTIFQKDIVNTVDSVKLLNEPSSVSLQQVASIGMTENEAYKLLYENSKEANERMISTIQWVIGLSITFLLAILGAQIFFNWRVNTKEIEYIKKDIEEQILQLKSELTGVLETNSKEKETIINTKLTTLESELKGKIDDKINHHIEYFKLKQEILKGELKSGLKHLKVEIEKNNGDIWLLKGIEANALSSYLQTAKLKVELNGEAKYILDDIISVLKELEEIHESDAKKLKELTESLPVKYSSQKSQIISLYKDKPVYRFNSTSNDPFMNRNFVRLFAGKTYVENSPK